MKTYLKMCLKMYLKTFDKYENIPENVYGKNENV